MKQGQSIDKEWLSKAVTTLKERSTTLVELAHSLRYYIAEDVEIDTGARLKFLNEKTLPYLSELRDAFIQVDNFIAENIEKKFITISEKYNIKLGALAQPVRVAITGGTKSPGIFEVLEIVGKERTLRRLEKAIKLIKVS
jgi:glutamyl-tRNA synthetase